MSSYVTTMSFTGCGQIGGVTSKFTRLLTIGNCPTIRNGILQRQRVGHRGRYKPGSYIGTRGIFYGRIRVYKPRFVGVIMFVIFVSGYHSVI